MINNSFATSKLVMWKLLLPLQTHVVEYLATRNYLSYYESVFPFVSGIGASLFSRRFLITTVAALFYLSNLIGKGRGKEINLWTEQELPDGRGWKAKKQNEYVKEMGTPAYTLKSRVRILLALRPFCYSVIVMALQDLILHLWQVCQTRVLRCHFRQVNVKVKVGPVL
jgi:hypothetical protein